MRAPGSSELTGAKLYATGQGLMPAPAPAPAETPLFPGFRARHASGTRPAPTQHGLELGLDDAFLGMAGEIGARDDCPRRAVRLHPRATWRIPGRFQAAVELARTEVEAVPRAGGSRPTTSRRFPASTMPPTSGWQTSSPRPGSYRSPRSGPAAFPCLPSRPGSRAASTLHRLAAAAGARGIAVGVKKGYYDIKHESVAALGSGWSLALDSVIPEMPQQPGSLRDDLPALTARKRAEAGTNTIRPLHGQTGSLTAGAAKLFSKAVAAPPKNKIRAGAR